METTTMDLAMVFAMILAVMVGNVLTDLAYGMMFGAEENK